LALCAAIAASMSAASCSFAGSDMFQNWLQYAEGSYDLSAATGIAAGELRVARIERLESSAGLAAVFVLYYDAEDVLRLSVLSEDMTLEAELSGFGLGLFLGADDVGNFVCGSACITPSFAIGGTVSYSAAPQASGDIAKSAYELILGSSSGSTTLSACSKSSASTLLGYATPIESGKSFELLDSEILSGGTRLFALFRSQSGAGEIAALGFPDSYSSLSSALDGLADLISNPSLSSIILDEGSASSGWLTSDGAILLAYGNGAALERFSYETGKLLDSIRVDTEWASAPSFAPAGDYWYYYDRGKGLVRKMRSWWK
jgi:hypothetical protein